MWNLFLIKYTQWRYFLPTLLLTKTRGVTCIVGETLCNSLWNRKKVWKCSFKFFNQNDITQIYVFFLLNFGMIHRLVYFYCWNFLNYDIYIFFFIFVSIQKYITYFYYPIINTPSRIFLNPLNTELLKVLHWDGWLRIWQHNLP